jgi:hypothetical protein
VTKSRYIHFDLLRAIIIFSAFVIHFDEKIEIGRWAVASVFFQRYVFTVGAFFFFTAGYMASRIYLPRFQGEKIKTSIHIWQKGFFILILYAGYVLMMHLFTITPLSEDIIRLIYKHSYQTRVLVSFGLLYLLIPVILFFVVKIGKWFVFFLLLLLSAVFIAYDPSWDLSEGWRVVVFDRGSFLYPMLSTLITFLFGFVIAHLEEKFEIKSYSKTPAVIALVIIIFYIGAVISLPWFKALIRSGATFTFVESLTPYLFILVAGYVMSLPWGKSFFDRPIILCIGIKSLTFYVLSNMFLGFLLLPKHAPAPYKYLAFICIIFLAYLFTYWNYNSTLYKIGQKSRDSRMTTTG